MVARLWPVLVLLSLACGGGADAPDEQPGPITVGGGGQVATAGAAGSGGDVAAAGSSSAGTDPVGGGGSSAGSGGQGEAGAAGGSGPAGGTGGAGGSTAGAAGTAGGASGATQGGAAGSAGTGGKPVDPLDPKPADNCPGYVDVLVPVGTCLLIKGEFTTQTGSCDGVDPPVSRCATVSANTKDLVTRRSVGASFERFDLETGIGCPKSCSGN